MLTSFLITIASSILGVILNVFPSSPGLPEEFHNALATLTGYVGILDPLVPIQTLATALSIIFLYEFTVFSFKGLAWVYHKVPFIGK